jgi:hypothetical protein
MPAAARPAASSGLLFRQDYRAFRLAGVPQFQRHAVRGIRFQKMKDMFPEEAAFQPLLQHVRS